MNNKTENDCRWRAVLQRAPAAFIYAVKTTGVYCLPQCAAKKPLRKNTEFFARTEDAARAGYRPCKKCRPDSPPGEQRIAAACRRLEETDAPPLAELAADAGISARHFHRIFSRLAGITPKQYAQQARREKWRNNLPRAKRITDAVYDSGFGSGARAYENVYADLGMTPAARKNGGEKTAIQYAAAGCFLGRVLVAATARGVCAINFGDSDSALRAELLAQFPAAAVFRGGKQFRALVQKTAKSIAAPRAVDLPPDIQGTVFQQKVWRALQQIPFGQTAAYSKIAAQIGAPKAARAVAAACAKNPLAAAIPCHRAVGKDGNLRGYRWGLKRKKALLAREKQSAKRAENQ
ncbi:MAG: bifunctional DNA-binding transcriptional regulator/O6-methylguanine-DNA methyltransferase Ada [Betaproteobacteria bacterium]|nr:bifunctional DNA-binding transcriptional regulator/O6-methylguanine-DNA methyltransferase Ada [Betaproteobacteria bacterium]